MSAEPDLPTLSGPPRGVDPCNATTVAPVSVVDSVLLPHLPWQPGFVFLDDFEVEGVLGQGGMGVVYRVRQRSTGVIQAVKRARLAVPEHRRRFLAELQLWIDLPVHPHLMPCRYFRSVNDEVVLFTDLAEGGSLADWIVEGRLTRAEDVLDVAIQVARGLHALHEHGLVHQDVKPANVLLVRRSGQPDAEGCPAHEARLADFGLARARARVRQPGGDAQHQSISVTGGAMTPAYCSPEQASGKSVTRRTDVWSWGVLVLEMFVGRVPCCELGGTLAPDVLERYLRTPSSGPIERMPPGLSDLLRLCLCESPSERWPDLALVADELEARYRSLCGRDYPRPAPLVEAADPGELLAKRPAAWAGEWESPRKWLTRAFQAAGRDPTEVESVLPAPAASRKAQVVADLAVYEEARLLFEQVVAEGRDDLESPLAALLVQKALIHVSAGDGPGARELLDRAIARWQELIYQRRRLELTPLLVRTWLHKARWLRGQADHAGAMLLCDRVIRLWEGLDNRRARRDLRDDLAAAYLEKGLALRGTGKARAALELYDRAIDLWKPMVLDEGQQEPASDLAQAYLSKVSVLTLLGRSAEALELCDEAIAIRRRLVQREGRRELQGDLARALLHKANVLRASDDVHSALPLYEQAIGLCERLVVEEGRDDLAGELARACVARANAERALGQHRMAADLCGRAAAIWEGLIRHEGRRELTPELARAYLHRGTALRAAGEANEAILWCDRALVLYERLVGQELRQELGNDLARACIGKANVLRALGKPAGALELYDRALGLRREILSRTTRDDVQGDLARDRVGRAEILLELNDVQGGRSALEEAASDLEAALARTPRPDLQAVLTRARKLLRRLTTEPGSE